MVMVMVLCIQHSTARFHEQYFHEPRRRGGVLFVHVRDILCSAAAQDRTVRLQQLGVQAEHVLRVEINPFFETSTQIDSTVLHV